MKFIMQLFLLFTLCLASFSSFVFSAKANSPSYFFIYLQWPKTQCSSAEGCCLPKRGKPVLNDFIISELQPYFKKGNYIGSNCTTTTKFQPSKIADLVPSLEKKWPSLSCPSRDSRKLWIEEWLEYGTCSESVLNQHDYFGAALKVLEQINLLNTLIDAGIKPNGTYYPGELINKALKKAGFGEIGVSCRSDENGINAALDKVILCASIKGKNYPCPGYFWLCDSRNGNAVKFPPPLN